MVRGVKGGRNNSLSVQASPEITVVERNFKNNKNP